MKRCKLIILLILINSVMHINSYADEVVKFSEEKKAMITERMELEKRYKPEGSEEFIKKVLAGNEFRGGLLSRFIFHMDNTFILKFHDYDFDEKFTEKGTWDIKNGFFVVKFLDKHKKWSGKYKLDFFLLIYNEKKNIYSITMYIKDKTPWNDQALSIDFK
ncbi:MAG TPA: hypothetical protein PK926_16980 [Spirochaetota bacterium]|nr:hypothetical protein [Spirochaetota bacterium]